MSRKYQPYWQKLKSDGTCLIEADRSLHLITAKMIRKEANRDKPFNDDVRLKQRRYYISSASLGDKLRINLVWTA